MSDILDTKLVENFIDEHAQTIGFWIKLKEAIQSGALSPQDNTRQQEGWTPVADWPIKSGQNVFVSYLNPLGKRRTVKAFYAEKFTIEAHEDEDNLEYNEENDTYYWPEGWYEVIDNWDEFSSIAIHSVVDYVMPLPSPPTKQDAT